MRRVLKAEGEEAVRGSTGLAKAEEALLEGGLLSEVQKRVASDYQRSVGGDLADVVVRLGFLTEEQVKRAIERGPRLSVSQGSVVRRLVDRVPFELLRGYRVIPVEQEGETLLACENAEMEPIVLEELWGLLGVRLPVVQAEEGTVVAALDGLSGRVSVPPFPAPSIEDLVALLLEKGVITEAELRSRAAGVRAAAPQCAR